jgi:tetratricopeptide (TPR) repeat protein
MESEAEKAIERLRKIAPDSSLLKKDKAAKSEQPPAKKEKPAKAVPEPASAQTEDDISLEITAPAVPLTRGEEEFAAGRLTQAEILDKYGLHDQALQQVREVIERFPGSVEAQEKLVYFLRTSSDNNLLQEALVGLALARKAVGDVDEARTAAAEARRIGPLEAKEMEQLEKLDLFQEAAPEPEPAVEEPDREPPPTAKQVEEGEQSIVLIDFDAVEEEEEAAAEAELPLPIPPAVPPITAAPTEQPEAPASEPSSAKAAPEPEAEPEPGARPEPRVAAQAPAADIAGDDLAAITAALESDVFSEETETRSGGAEEEQSLDEVFASFRKHVEEEVDSKDFRTHYDLGIAYKEMGFLDEAIAEFEQCSASPDLGREVNIMLAMCFKEKGQTNRAIACYRQAIDLPGAEQAAMNGLRYELAELLAETGDGDAALELFQTVKQDDPSFRDVDARVQQLETDIAG